MAKVLSDKNRIKILLMIFKKPGISGKEIIIDSKQSQPIISFHLKKLIQGKIIVCKKSGQSHYYPNYEHIKELHTNISNFYNKVTPCVK